MGFSSEEMTSFQQGRTPSRFGRDRLSNHDAAELAIIAQDALHEMGYEAAAAALRPASPDYLDGDAREAMAILEAGPPSILLDRHIVYRRPLHKFTTDRHSYIIARSINDHALPWYRFLVGRSVHNNRGDWVGWDPDAGHTFQFRSKTLKEAREGTWGMGAERLDRPARRDTARSRYRR